MKKSIITLFALSFGAISFAQNAKPFRLQQMTNLPDEYFGIGCFYAASKADFEADKLIYVSNLTTGIVSIEGFHKKFYEKYDGSGNRVTFEGKEVSGVVLRKTVKAYPTGSIQSGTINITYKNKNRSIPFYGYCGD